MENILKDQRCVVLGSGPSDIFEHQFVGSRIIAANGGGAYAFQFGLHIHVLCTTSYICRPNADPSEIESRNTWKHRGFFSAWVDVTCGSFTQYLRCKRELGMKTINDNFIDEQRRGDIVKRACGTNLGWDPNPFKRVSTGVFAVCLAVASGCREVIVTGVSVSSRHHVDADMKCLSLMKTKSVLTTSSQLSSRTGLRIAA